MSKKVIDYCVASVCLDPIIKGIEAVPVPWGPHIGLELLVSASPRKVLVNKLIEPIALPMVDFHSKWKQMSHSTQVCLIRANAYIAHQMLVKHSLENCGPAILGTPHPGLVSDYKFQNDLKTHVLVGEVMAQAALQAELTICSVAGVPFMKYIGRSQYPMFALRPAAPKLHIGDKFTVPSANIWGLFVHRVRNYMNNRINDYRHSHLTMKLRNMVFDLDTLGAACSPEQLDLYKLDASLVSHDWKGPDFHKLSSEQHPTVQKALHDLDNVSDLVLVELMALGEDYKIRALRVRSNLSQKSWRQFCLDQLSKGAGILHRFVNRQNALPPAPLFRSGSNAKTPCQALCVEQEAWQRFWQKDPQDWDAHVVLQKLKAFCRNGLHVHTDSNQYDMEVFSADILRKSAKTYRKTSKGSDHWLASELCVDDVILKPIACAIDLCVVHLSWSHQMLCNLHPELLKISGGARTISKTPKLYRLWCRTRRPALKAWEASIPKPYDTCVRGMSALEAAAGRSLACEIATRNGQKSCATLFDLENFFDTIEPTPLLDSLVQTQFPMADATMAFQIHVSPRVILLSTLASEMIRVDLSILAGCIFSIPFVKSLMHEGSLKVCQISKNHKTYVDDIANFASGDGPEVQAIIVSAAIVFNEKLVIKRKFRFSSKSTVVASDLGLAKRVAAELKQHGISVCVSPSHRDLGIMFTAGASRDLSLAKTRISKAARRAQRITRIAKDTRASRNLFSTGALPQAIWAHQLTGLAPSHLLHLRRMAASTTGVSMHSQRCLVLRIFVCFGKRRDPWQTVVKELILLWVKLVPQFSSLLPMTSGLLGRGPGRMLWLRARSGGLV